MKRKYWITGGACAAIILLLASIGYQQEAIAGLRGQLGGVHEQLSAMEEQLQGAQEALEERIGSLESGDAALAASYSAGLSEIDPRQRTVRVSISVKLNESAEGQDVWMDFCGLNGEKPFQMSLAVPYLPLTLKDQSKNEYVEFMDFPMDAAGFKVVLFVGNRNEVLQTCTSIADMLPVQLTNCGGDVIYNPETNMYYQTEWYASLTDNKIASASFQIYKNGKVVETSGAGIDSNDGGDGGNFTCWDQANSHQTPCKPGDAFEMHFVCTDEFGIQYDFLAERRVITETYPARCWPETVTPTITWPE